MEVASVTKVWFSLHIHNGERGGLGRVAQW